MGNHCKKCGNHFYPEFPDDIQNAGGRYLNYCKLCRWLLYGGKPVPGAAAIESSGSPPRKDYFERQAAEPIPYVINWAGFELDVDEKIRFEEVKKRRDPRKYARPREIGPEQF